MNLGFLAGMVAWKQLTEGRHFISENPAGSKLYDLPPWQQIATDPRVHYTIMHQCAAGLTDPENQRPIKKPTEFWASDYCLIEQLASMQCACKVPHSTLEGTYKGIAKTHAARTWPWRLAATIANGISALIRQKYKNSCKTIRPGSMYHSYPVTNVKIEPGSCPPFEQKSRSRATDW